MSTLTNSSKEILPSLSCGTRVRHRWKQNKEGSNLVSLKHSLVNNLLQLDVVEVRPNHHLQHLEKLAVRDDCDLASDRQLDGEAQGLRTSVIVDIVDAESNCIGE